MNLTAEQAKLVMRRAVRIESERAGTREDHLSPTDVDDIAAELDLTPEAVRRALAEFHAGALAEGDGERTPLDRAIGPARVVVEREVAGAPATVVARVNGFLANQLLEVRRDHGDRRIWGRATSVWARIRHALDIAGRYHFPDGSEVESAVVAVPGAEDRSLVRLEIRLGEARASRVRGAAGGIAVGAAAAAAGILLTGGHPPVELVAIGAGGAIAAGSFVRARRRFRRDLARAQGAVELLLDRVEHPPLPGW